MSLDVGKLDKRMGVEYVVRSEDSSGDAIETWMHLRDVWASLEPVSVRDFIASRSEQSEVTARIQIRYCDDITPSMRFTHRGKVYNIVGILPDKDSGLESLTFAVTQGVNQG